MRRALTTTTSALFLLTMAGCAPCEKPGGSWVWKQRGPVLEVAYGNATTGWPQMAALHTNTGALRLNYGPGSGWGPTVYVPPALWTTETGGGERHYLGAPVSVTVAEADGDLVLDMEGAIGGLSFAASLRFSPPEVDRFVAAVALETLGTVSLANRPGEAFKPVQAASMHISGDDWDSHSVRIDDLEHPLPAEGWVLDPPGVVSDTFTLVGGSSRWKANAPNITVELDHPMPLQGWVTPSANPNDDNVGFWCASDTVLDTWEYRIIAAR